jgi:hypothetical protein
MTFVFALLGFLMARLLWDAIKHFARKQDELPIIWFAKTATLLFALMMLLGGVSVLFLYALSRVYAH